MIEQTKIAVIGCGMWGRNIIRNAAALGALAAVIDTDNMRASDFAKQFNCDFNWINQIIQE